MSGPTTKQRPPWVLRLAQKAAGSLRRGARTCLRMLTRYGYRLRYGPGPDFGIRFDILILCNHFASEVPARHTGGEFIRARARAYRDHGLHVLVVEIDRNNRRYVVTSVDDITCVRINVALFEYFGARLIKDCGVVAAHSATPQVADWLSANCSPQRIVYWFHGADVRDYRRLSYNYSAQELEAGRAQLERTRNERQRVARRLFTEGQSTCVFVSSYLQTIAEIDVGNPCSAAILIPNFIDGEFFRYESKDLSMRSRVLLLRPFTSKNYAADIAISAIAILLRDERAAGLEFTICGYGENFSALTAPLSGHSNVTVHEGVLSRQEMRDMFRSHGVILAPTRHDTQGVTMCEAMAGGLVPVTHRVAAIPEFVPAGCGELVWSHKPDDFAAAILRLSENANVFAQKSAACAAFIRAKCNAAATVERELQLLRVTKPMPALLACVDSTGSRANMVAADTLSVVVRRGRIEIAGVDDIRHVISLPASGHCEYGFAEVAGARDWLRIAGRIAEFAGPGSVILIDAEDPLAPLALLLFRYFGFRYALTGLTSKKKVATADYALLSNAAAVYARTRAERDKVAARYPGVLRWGDGPPSDLIDADRAVHPGKRRAATAIAPIRVLLIAYFAGPCSAVGAKRVNYWFDELDTLSGGLTETHLATAMPPATTDPRIHYVPDVHGLEVAGPADQASGQGILMVRQEQTRSRQLNTLSFYWRIALERYFVALEQTFDVVVISGNPFEYFAFADFSRSHWNAKVVLDYRDPFALNPAIKLNQQARAIAGELEMSYNTSADLIITVNEVCRDLVVGADEAPVIVIENGVDERVFGALEARPLTENRINFVHAGSFNSYRRPDNLIAALDSERDALHHIGRVPDLAPPFDRNPAVTMHGLLPYEQAMALMANAHCGVMFVSGMHFESTTKIYDYLYLGLDILVVSPDGLPGGPIVNLPSAQEKIHWVRDDVAELSTFLANYRPTKRDSRSDLRYTRATSTAILAQAIRNLVQPTAAGTQKRRSRTYPDVTAAQQHEHLADRAT